eukprot:gb/GECG01005051.1/.p1 GENE.gb/GECG01005051.1/~~gb/GECG01005051.1/.p1  ORF type:complete len:426 (+),score=86.58 gb/GECG01005051.1/:1-1278(+)
MPLESVMVCLDNSEWMRNGDCTPSRLDAQYDAAFLVCNSKMNENPENTVGLLTHGGGSVAVKTSPSEDLSKVLASLHGIQCRGKPHFGNAIRVAMLALKHRKNKNGGQRIVIFVGSPIEEEERQLKKIGATLRKNNIALDIVAMGENDKNQEKFQKINEAVNNNENSHIVNVPAGVNPSDSLLSSPIISAGGGAAGAGQEQGQQDLSAYGGVDPNVDPELAQAIRLSLEESRAEAEEQDRSESVPPSATGVEASQNQTSNTQGDIAMTGNAEQQEEPTMSQQGGGNDEDEMLERAIAMSMMENEQASDTPMTRSATSGGESQGVASRSQPASEPATTTSTTPGSQEQTTPSSASFQDPNFVNELLGGLPGVDMNDPNIQAALRQIQSQSSNSGSNNDGNNQSSSQSNNNQGSGNNNDDQQSDSKK